MSSKHIPEVEKMIKSIMKQDDCSEAEAIAYMLKVATGRLRALKRYGDTLPEGKSSKGVLAPTKKKRAPRAPAIKVPEVKAAS